jgi:hypothetical protein
LDSHGFAITGQKIVYNEFIKPFCNIKSMNQLRSDTKNPVSFARLMRLGQVAHAQGDNKSAHQYWRQAALLEPDNEQVWTALMWVVESDDDRKVCLKNILAINPQNLRAQTLLDELLGETKPDGRIKTEPESEIKASRINPGYIVLRFAESLWLGGLLATAIIALQFLF